MFSDELDREAQRIWAQEKSPTSIAGRYYEMESDEERDSRRLRYRRDGHATEPWQELQRGFTNAGARA